MESPVLLDAIGRPRSPATLPGHFAGRPPRNKGRRYPADPPHVEEIVAVMRAAGRGASGDRMRALVVVLWRAGLRIGEALALVESDLDPTRGSILVRHGKGDKRRESGMDDWAWDQVGSWMAARQAFPVGPLFCVITGPTAGRPWRERVCRSTSSSATRTSESRRSTAELMRSEAAAHARLAAEPAEVSAHGALLQGIDSGEIVAAVHGRPAPVMPASAGLRLA